MADIVFTGQAPAAIIGEEDIPANVDMKLYKGDAYTFNIAVDDSTNSPVLLDDGIPTAQFRERYESTEKIDLVASINDLGYIEIYISSAVSSQLDASKSYIWDVQTKKDNGDVKTWATGDVEVMNEVTR
jgi:hypothetical protein